MGAAVEDAIINKGYKIDYRGFIGDMLKRTEGDVGGKGRTLQDGGRSSRYRLRPLCRVGHEDAAAPGTATVGHRKLPEGGNRDQVNTILGEIIGSAAEGF